ncbi:MAG: hypothetical protein AAE977_03165 [Thermoplasmataceae archaeon]|jgi:hypothetical protein
MLINEVNLFLDKRGRISFNFEIDNQPIWNAANLTSVAKIRITGKGGFIIVNNKSDVSNQDVITEFQRRNAIHIGDSWSLNLDISKTTLLSFFIDLISIPSVVVDSIIIKGTKFLVDFRYHHNDHPAISVLAANHIDKLKDFAFPFLGNSGGLIQSLKELNEEVPMQYMEVESVVPPNLMEISKDPVIATFGNNWLREIKYLQDEKSYAVYYERNQLLKEGMNTTEISRSEKIYETTFTNPVITFLYNKCSERSIAPLGMGQKLFGRTFSYYMIVPRMHLEGFSKILLEAFSSMKDWKMNLAYSMRIDRL